MRSGRDLVGWYHGLRGGPMHFLPGRVLLLTLLAPLGCAIADDSPPALALTVPAGAPLRVYLTKRISKRAGAPVEAKVLEAVYSFDREVIPAGATVMGRISRLDPATKWQRTSAIMGGDFTPLHIAKVEFTEVVMPTGSHLALHTAESASLNSIYVDPPKPKRNQKAPSPNNTGVLGTAKQTTRDQINAQINGRLDSRTYGLGSLVRGPNKKERFVDFAMSKLPYHPQFMRRGTRFDADLLDPLQFGSATLQRETLAMLGTQPGADSVVWARLTTPLDSASAQKGDAVTAVLAQPLFSPDHKLILPEGTKLTGSVVVARKARWFHRGGQLRFNFQKVDLTEEALNLRPRVVEFVAERPAPISAEATLEAGESSGKAQIKVDSEGGVQATEPKTRFIAPALSLLVASRAADNDAGHTNGGSSNVGGRTLGGGSGFGTVGMVAAQSSRYVGMAFGYYGLAFSVYANIVARGGEVQFDKNALVVVKFGTRTPPQAAKFQADSASPQ